MSRNLRSAALTAMLSLAAGSLRAADQYWDTNGTASGLGNNGGTPTWNTTNSNWNTDPTGGAGGTVGTWGANNNALFAGTAGTVTVNTAATVSVGGIAFNVSGYTITGANNATGTLTMVNGSIIDVGNNSANLDAVLGGGAGIALTKTGGGTLSLGGGTTNSIGVMTINEGIVDLNKSGGAVALPAGVIIGTGLSAANAAIARYVGTGGDQIGNGGTVQVRVDGKLDFNGKSDLFAAMTLFGNATQAATVTTTAASTGQMTFNNLVTFNGGGALDSGTSTGKMVLNAGIANITYTANNGSMATIAGRMDLGATVAGGSTRTFTIGNDTNLGVDMRVSAVLSNGLGSISSLTKAGAGTLELSGASAYTLPTLITAGTLLASSNDALGTADNGTTVNSNTTLAFGGGVNYTTAEAVTINGNGDATNSRAGAIDNVAGSNTFAGPVTLASNSTIGSSAGNLTFTGGINGNAAGRTLAVNGAGNVAVSTVGIGSNVSTVTKSGAGTLTLGATNSYTGATSVNAGTLIVNGSIASNTTVASGAALGGRGTITGNVSNSGTVAPGNSPGTLTVTGTYSGAGGLTLEVDANGNVADLLDIGQTATVSGAIDIVRLDASAVTTSRVFDLLRADVLTIPTLATAQADAAAAFAGSGAAVSLLLLPNEIGSDDVLRLTLLVPEPSAVVALLIGGGVLGFARQRRAISRISCRRET